MTKSLNQALVRGNEYGNMRSQETFFLSFDFDELPELNYLTTSLKDTQICNLMMQMYMITQKFQTVSLLNIL